MAIEISVDLMLKEIGHDGSEIIYPDQPEPRRRRAFHTQECIQVLDRRGYAATPFDAIGSLVLDDEHQIDVNFTTDFENHLRSSHGVILGQGVNNRHAVAWVDQTVFDPNGYIYGWDDLVDHCTRQIFVPQTFWKIQKI